MRELCHTLMFKPYLCNMRPLFTAIALLTLLSTLHAQVPSYVPSNGLVGWWPFHGNANDESGNGNNGAVNGATPTADRFGLANQAFSFNGVSDWIEVPPSSSLNALSSELSIAGWIQVMGYDNNRFPILEKSNNQSGDVQLSLIAHDIVGTTNGLLFQDIQGYVAQNYSDYYQSVGLMQWSHVVITLNGDSIITYVDGSKVYSVGQIGTVVSTDHALVFGKAPFGPIEYANGLLDDFGIWNRALSPCEVQALYNAGSQGVSPTPVSFSGLNSSYTLADAPSTLVGSPSGGVFIGPGVTGSTFVPAAAGIGQHSIIYSYVDECGSVNSAGLCTEVTLNVGVGGSHMSAGGVHVYPNPNRGQFTVELELAGLVGLQVYDARGALVHNEVFTASGSRTQRIRDLSTLVKGSYTLLVQHDGQRVSQSVVLE